MNDYSLTKRKLSQAQEARPITGTFAPGHYHEQPWAKEREAFIEDMVYLKDLTGLDVWPIV